MNTPTELIEPIIETEEAPLGGGGGEASLIGAGVGFISTVPAGGGDGDSPLAGAGAGVISVEPEGGGESVPVLLLLSANTMTTNFSFLRQWSLLPLTK